MRKLRATFAAVMKKIRDLSRKVTQSPPTISDIMRSLLDIAKISYVIVVILSYIIALMFAGLSYKEGGYWEAIVATGLLATGLLVVQTMDRNSFRPRTWRFRVAWNTLIVGVAIHYSAIIIGVSFGGVFTLENDGNWDIVAVLVQQAALTRAAWVLVNEYRHSNTARTDRNAQGG